MVSFRAFSKRFGSVEAVKSLTFDVAPGDVVALLGPNGSGKSTSLKAAAGLVRPTSGSVAIGSPARPASDPAARRACSFLPQHVSFPEALTGREVVEFFGALRERPAGRAREALHLAALNGAGDRAVRGYSGGMRQRLALAVATLADAPLLLLDEPTASLDPEGLQVFYELVDARRRQGQTVLFSSHQMGDVERLADRFIVLVHGEIAASLTSGELAARLADRGSLHLTLGTLPDGLRDRVTALAPGAVWKGGELVVPAPAAVRLAVLDLVRASGVEVRNLSARDGRLDDLYLDLVRPPA
jgi:Cu-processing system ATP-binding protein